MARDWKPGDVAAIPFGDGDHRAFLDEEGKWVVIGKSNSFHYASIRPLVVIDPEDREQVDLFCKSLVEHMNRAGDRRSAAIGVHPATVMAALRDLADPKAPKPEEPTGLGAVVVDRKGNYWTRVWRASGHRWIGVDFLRNYVDIDAVEVLSQGVTP